MNLFAAASAPGSTVRKVVVKSPTLVYGCAPRTRTGSARRPAAAATPRTGSSAACSRSRATSATSPTTTRTSALSLLRFSNVLGPDIVTPLIEALQPARRAVDRRVRPTVPVRARGRRRRRHPVRAGASARRHLQRRRRRAAPVERGGVASAASGRRPCRPSAPASPPRRCAASASSTSRPSSSSCSATAGASTTAASRRPASTTGTRRPARCEAFVEAMRLRTTVGDPRPRVPVPGGRRALLPPLAGRVRNDAGDDRRMRG